MLNAARTFLLTVGTFASLQSLAQAVDFVHDVRPILQKHCYACHGPEKQKSSLRLDIKSEAFKGGDAYGPGIVPGNAQESVFIQFVSDPDADLQMPPEGRLSEAEIRTLTEWVNDGAVWPDGVDTATLVDKLDHWSFRKPEVSPPPHVRNESWCRNDIDRFILAKLEESEFQPADEASSRIWLRRVTFDLTGLPPTPEESLNFQRELQDPNTADKAYENVVERLLQSPRYGERWAQHWLDVVRYADTHGFEVNTERPNAWPYRDYVIESFNNDTPYDQFVREQIVGDAFGKDAATGFLITASVLLPGQIGADEPSKRLARQDSINEIVTNIGQTFLGLSIGCARCHDHKFDPISHHDYYSMQAFVAGVEYADREIGASVSAEVTQEVAGLRTRLLELERQLTAFIPLASADQHRPAVNARINTDRFAPVSTKRLRFEILSTNTLEPCLDELEVINTEGMNVALAEFGTQVKSSGDTTVVGVHELRHVNDGQVGNTHSWMSNEPGKGWIELEFPQEQVIERVNWGRDRTSQYKDRLATTYRIQVADAQGNWITVSDETDRSPYTADQDPALSPYGAELEADARFKEVLDQQIQLTDKIARLQARQLAFCGTFRNPDEIRLLTRGDPEQPKDVTPPAILSAFSSVKLPMETAEQERRRILADWIASPDNLFTARVMANRIWQGHFGTGLVETASDFGRSGMAPSHPELLNWLGARFVQDGWSVKQMHRLIVLSATYRQSSKFNPEAAAEDASVRLLWRYPLRRHDAETIRDSILACSGRLNLKMGGPGFDLFNLRGGLSGFIPVERFDQEGHRRMIYAHNVRRERDPVFGAFDRPDGGQSMARRSESTTPLQALNLFNSQFVLDESNALAERVRQEAGGDAEQQIIRIWQLILGRNPTEEELADARVIASEHGMAMNCRVLFNSNEFLFMP
ncbi:PSD1 and planctomycete cytochrome C domain-containing protein [Planctomicrobium sp. SH661]|uniref:PSD1 and planctomycete cytochrome C domain-containing protein n=1 Tax=Planctomicrobium sp. SH661 TaxID=3448124 RepID=UPI003F5C403B